MGDALLFIVVLLISGAVYLIGRLGRAAQGRREQQSAPPARPPLPREGQEAPRGAGLDAAARPAPMSPPTPFVAVTKPPPVPVPAAASERLRRPPAASRRERLAGRRPRTDAVSATRAREGMVLAAILGPCRAFLPFDEAGTSQP